MYGAILGDTIGSPYEFDMGNKRKEFPLFSERSTYTDDTVMTFAVAVESCQETVPEAITAFLEGESFEDVIRTAVSLGGDCDTLTCIAGSIAEGFYGVPEDLKQECRNRLLAQLLKVLSRFDECRNKS